MNNVIQITMSHDETLPKDTSLIKYDPSSSVPDRLKIIMTLMTHALENLLEEEYGDKVNDAMTSLKAAPFGAVMGSFIAMIESQSEDTFNLGPLLTVIDKVNVVKTLLGSHGNDADAIH